MIIKRIPEHFPVNPYQNKILHIRFDLKKMRQNYYKYFLDIKFSANKILVAHDNYSWSLGQTIRYLILNPLCYVFLVLT